MFFVLGNKLKEKSTNLIYLKRDLVLRGNGIQNLFFSEEKDTHASNNQRYK